MICNICKHESLPKYTYKGWWEGEGSAILYECTNSLCRFIQIDYECDQEQREILDFLGLRDVRKTMTKPSKSIFRRVDFFKNYLVGKNIVDLGSGCARYEQALDQSEIKCNIKSVDFWDWAIEYCKDHMNKTVLKYDIENEKLLELGEGVFDFIISSHTFEHVNRPTEILRMWSKLLNKDGHILIEVPDTTYADTSIADEIDIWFSGLHYSYFNPDNLELLLSTLGFDIVHKFLDPKGTKHCQTIIILGKINK